MYHEPIEWKMYCCPMSWTHLKSERNLGKSKVQNIRKHVVDTLRTDY